MGEYSGKLFARVTRTMCEWSGADGLDDHHIELLVDMILFSIIPILLGTCDTEEKVAGQVKDSIIAAFNLGYAKGLSDHDS